MQIFREKNLLILGLAESISGIGDWITMMAVLAMLVFRGGGGVMESSGVFLAGLLPIMIVSPIAGWLVDRVNRRTLLIASQLLAGIVVSGLYFVDQNYLIYGILAMEAVVISVVSPARQAVIPDLVSRDDLPRANALLQQLAGLVKVFSPFMAGIALTVMDPHTAILFDAASFFISAGIMTLLPSLPPHREETGTKQSAGSANPFKVLKTELRLKMLFVVVFIAILGIVGFDVLSSIYTRDVLQKGEQIFGLSISLVGVGALIATMMIMLRKKNTNPWIDLMIGIGLLGLIPLVLAFVIPFGQTTIALYLVMAACLVGGIGNGFAHVQVGTIMQLSSPPEILGQVGGWLQSVMVSSQIIGMVVTPILVPGIIRMDVFFGGMSVIMGLVVVFLAMQMNGLTKPVLLEGREETG